MKKLNERELMQVQGGAVSKFLIGGLIVLGIFNGFKEKGRAFT